MSLADKLGIKMSSRTITLPSNGIYGGLDEVVVRPLLARDEKFIASIDEITGEKSLHTLAKSVVIDPVLEIDDLIDADILFILLVSKCLTYGDQVTASYNCKTCGEPAKHDLKIFDFSIQLLQKSEFTILLPQSELEITYKISTIGEKKKVEAAYRQKYNLMHLAANQTDIQNQIIASVVKRVAKDGEEIGMTLTEKYEMITELLTKKDMDIWADDVSKNSVNPEYHFECECPACGADNGLELILTPDFFFTETSNLPSK